MYSSWLSDVLQKIQLILKEERLLRTGEYALPIGPVKCIKLGDLFPIECEYSALIRQKPQEDLRLGKVTFGVGLVTSNCPEVNIWADNFTLIRCVKISAQ